MYFLIIFCTIIALLFCHKRSYKNLNTLRKAASLKFLNQPRHSRMLTLNSITSIYQEFESVEKYTSHSVKNRGHFYFLGEIRFLYAKLFIRYHLSRLNRRVVRVISKIE